MGNIEEAIRTQIAKELGVGEEEISMIELDPEQVREIMGQQDSERDFQSHMALNMTSEKALRLASAALIGANNERRKGGKHVKCAKMLHETAALWIELGEQLREEATREDFVAEREESRRKEQAFREFTRDGGQAFDWDFQEGKPSETFQPKANLGLASTQELLKELEVRFHVSTPNAPAQEEMQRLLQQLDPETLRYRTVSGSEDRPVS